MELGVAEVRSPTPGAGSPRRWAGRPWGSGTRSAEGSRSTTALISSTIFAGVFRPAGGWRWSWLCPYPSMCRFSRFNRSRSTSISTSKFGAVIGQHRGGPLCEIGFHVVEAGDVIPAHPGVRGCGRRDRRTAPSRRDPYPLSRPAGRRRGSAALCVQVRRRIGLDLAKTSDARRRQRPPPAPPAPGSQRHGGSTSVIWSSTFSASSIFARTMRSVWLRSTPYHAPCRSAGRRRRRRNAARPRTAPVTRAGGGVQLPP